MYEVVYATGVGEIIQNHKGGLFLSDAVREAKALADGLYKGGEPFTVAIKDEDTKKLRRIWTEEDEEFKGAKS